MCSVIPRALDDEVRLVRRPLGNARVAGEFGRTSAAATKASSVSERTDLSSFIRRRYVLLDSVPYPLVRPAYAPARAGAFFVTSSRRSAPCSKCLSAEDAGTGAPCWFPPRRCPRRSRAITATATERAFEATAACASAELALALAKRAPRCCRLLLARLCRLQWPQRRCGLSVRKFSEQHDQRELPSQRWRHCCNAVGLASPTVVNTIPGPPEKARTEDAAIRQALSLFARAFR
jgi:hypothetical protein